jgi:hypothetical protein
MLRTFPRGILKKTLRAISGGGAARKPVVFTENKKTIRILPTKNPSVPVRRSRKHSHGTRRLFVVAAPDNQAARMKAYEEEAKAASRSDLIEKLGGRFKTTTKAPLKLLQETYVNMKASGLLGDV